MLENRENEPQESEKYDSDTSNPNHKQRVDEKMKRQRSIDNEAHIIKESITEHPPIAGQATGQTPISDSTSSSTGKQSDVGQTGDQTPTGDSTEFSYAKSAVLRELDLKQKKIAEQDQKIQEQKHADAAVREQKLKEADKQLQEIKQKGEEQPQEGQSDSDKNEDFYQGQGIN